MGGTPICELSFGSLLEYGETNTLEEGTKKERGVYAEYSNWGF